MTENILITEKIHKLFIKFSLPAIISMIIAGMQSIIDGIFLGNFVGSNAMASVNIAQPFIQLITGSTMMVCMGALSIIGRRLGEHRLEEAKNTFKTAFLCVLTTSILILILGVIFSTQLANLLGASDVLLPYVSTYIFIMSLFAPSLSFMYLFGFVDRLLGKPDFYLKATFLSIFLNVSLDYLFITKFNWGIAGAAFATGIAYSGAAMVVCIPILKKSSILNIFVGHFTPQVILPMIYNGLSEAVISIAAALTAFLFNITFLKIAGEDGVATFTSINYIAQFATLLMFGVSDGIGPIISYNYGNDRQDRVTATLKLALKVNLITGIILFTILFLGGRTLVSAFAANNQEVLDLAANGSKFYAFTFLMNGFNIVLSGYFTSIGKAKESVLIAGSRGIIFILIGISTLPMLLGIHGVWLTVPVAELVTVLISIYLIKKTS